jgi:aerobic-type carbon monoxide dehydrogenase small subunit (CoxS/CutS family)
MAKLALRVNGGNREVEADDPDVPLLYVLRDDLGLTGTKFGCGLAQCGACTVLIGGRAVRACTTPARTVAGQDIVTIEGLGTSDPGNLCRCGSHARVIRAVLRAAAQGGR